MPDAPLTLLEFSRGRMREVWTLHYGETAQQSYVTVHRAWEQDDGSVSRYEKPTQRFSYQDVPRVVAALQQASRMMCLARCAEVQAEMNDPQRPPRP